MASQRQVIFLVLLSLFTFSIAKKSSQVTGGIAIYWGQNNGDGTLVSTCDTGNYEIVLLTFLNTFGCQRNPLLNFDGHCDWSSCSRLQPEIEHCQQKGVKVFLSLGGPFSTYSLCSPEDAAVIATYLYDNFLSGETGPVGNVTLDGIDFNIQRGSNIFWDSLAQELDNFKQPSNTFYLSASPQCFMPDHYLDRAIRTGLFDYIFVQFYNNHACQYSSTGSISFLFQAWKAWTSYVRSHILVYMGLPAAPDAALRGGYIPPHNFTSTVLPFIQKASNYGGVVLWDRSLDNQTQFSAQIKDRVIKQVSLSFRQVY